MIVYALYTIEGGYFGLPMLLLLVVTNLMSRNKRTIFSPGSGGQNFKEDIAAPGSLPSLWILSLDALFSLQVFLGLWGLYFLLCHHLHHLFL